MTYFDDEALKGIVQATVGPLVSLVWDGEPLRIEGGAGVDAYGLPLPGMPIVSPAPDYPAESGGAVRIVIDTSPIATIGVDDFRTSFNATTNKQESWQYGIRHFNLTFRIEADGANPYAIAERLRTRWERPGLAASLRAIGIAVRESTNVVGVKGNWDNRVVAAATFDVGLSFAISERVPDEDTEAGGLWIETVGTLEKT